MSGENKNDGKRGVWVPYLAREPAALVALAASSTSIVSLLLYLLGVAEFGMLLRTLLVPGTLLLLGCLLWSRRQGKGELYQRLVSALWAGLLATLLYDLARVPAVLAGLPVFKAISYFGTVMLNQSSPSVTSEFAGWAYHLSNGIGFGLVYVLLVGRPLWWTAVLWGLALECLMLLTPYAEVFGYRVSAQFLAITVSAHIVYGLGLWGALKFWLGGAAFGAAAIRRGSLLAGPSAVALFGIGLIAADFHARFAQVMAPSPPAYLGRGLYVTWDVLEPDRVASAWIWQRFVEPDARFYLVRPFSRSARGTPFDLPEAVVRRSATRSATENLVVSRKLEGDAALAKLARMTHLFEITPWMEASDPQAFELGRGLLRAVEPQEKSNPTAALREGFKWLDGWYTQERGRPY